MAKPRVIVRGVTYRITRRILPGTDRLAPDPITNSIVLYCVALAARISGVQIHSLLVMRDYYEITATDALGQLPLFLRDAHRSITKCLNIVQGRKGCLWAPEPTQVTILPTAEDILDQVVETAVAPIEAGLTKHLREGRGVVLWEPGTRIAIRRPAAYFDPQGLAPPSVEFRIETAPVGAMSGTDWRRQVIDAVSAAAHRARSSLQACVDRGAWGFSADLTVIHPAPGS